MPSSETPNPNIPYTRSDIQDMVGGEMPTYLPQNAKVILAGCFAVNGMNPKAPDEVQVGNRATVAAKAVLLSQQPKTVFPVFVKQNRNDKHYYFRGYYKFKSLSSDSLTISAAEAASGRHGELAYVLQLEKA